MASTHADIELVHRLGVVPDNGLDHGGRHSRLVHQAGGGVPERMERQRVGGAPRIAAIGRFFARVAWAGARPGLTDPRTGCLDSRSVSGVP